MKQFVILVRPRDSRVEKWVTALAESVRRQGFRRIGNSGVAEAVLTALADNRVDLSSCKSAAEIQARLGEILNARFNNQGVR